MAGVLIDADVLIEILRGDLSLVERVAHAAADGPACISVLTAAELRAGARGDDAAIDSLIADFEVVPVDLASAEQGGRYRRTFSATHGTGLIDAILAATAQSRGLALVTNNSRHFPMEGLVLA
jgi:predicted nucleic acid-binding protein